MGQGFIPISVGQPYMDAVSALADKTGDAIILDGLKVVTFTFVLGVGAGTVTGAVYIEHTSQMTGTVTAYARTLLPVGCLHTSMTTVALSTPVSTTKGSLTCDLTAATTGNFSITVSDLPAGQMRAVFDWASGTGASPNTLSCYVSGWG